LAPVRPSTYPARFTSARLTHVKFANGDKFYADLGQASTLSSAAPAAFGFLGGTSAPVIVKDGAILVAQPSQPISMVAGDIEINNGGVLTPEGDIRVVALGKAAQEIGFAGTLTAASGKLNILSGGSISSPATGAIDGGVIAISAGNIAIVNGGAIHADTFSSGARSPASVSSPRRR
jgi:hypothetical protein